jgi:hypothetical protein
MVHRLRPAFSRETAFEWFVLILFAMLLRLEVAGVTSFVRALGLAPNEYRNLLHFFHSTATSAGELSRLWFGIAAEEPFAVKLEERLVVLLDAIKIAKEGRKMPAVKWQHQESENNTKPEFIRGHYWGGLALLARRSAQFFAVPIRFQIQDGIKTSPSEKGSLVDKMARMSLETISTTLAYFIGDAYFASRAFIEALVLKGQHFIGRVRYTTVAYEPASRPAGGRRRRGRPKEKGPKLILRRLFEDESLFTLASTRVYADLKEVRYRVLDLFWNHLPFVIRFVLTIYANGARRILISTDTNLSAEQIIEAYSWRFKIEVSFKTMVRLIGAFAYHFWLMAMKFARRKAKDLYLHRASPDFRRGVWRKIEAYERFVAIGAIAVGMLQVLALRYFAYIRGLFPIWLRTYPRSNYPTELVTRSALYQELHEIPRRARKSLLVTEILNRRGRAECAPESLRIPA